MSDKQMTPVEALTIIDNTMKGITVDAGLHVNWYLLDALTKIKETATAGLQAASQPPAVKGGMPPLDKPTLTDEDMKAWEQSEAEERTVKGAVWVKGEYELAFIPCASDDPRRIGAYQSTDGESEFSVRELHLPVEPKGAVWFYCWKDDPKSNGQYFVETNMGRKVVANYNKEAKWCPQDFPMWTDGERPYKFQDDESPTAAGDGKEDLALVAAMTEEGAEMWKMEYDSARRILQELVDLKDLKESEGKTADYMVRQPVAWLRAKRFLEKYQHINW